MDWRSLGRCGRDRGPAFYLTALEYSHYLWRHGRAARAILGLDRALGADLRGDEPVLAAWPLPYAAMAWFLSRMPPGRWVGNPRVHFQHYAGRMNEPRREQRRWRAWACWALARRVLPYPVGDPRHKVVEPTEEMIAAKLAVHGFPGEAELWRAVLRVAGPAAVH
ncbi:MAG: hypothetical protein A3G75_10255 [Verrucomicrobia bacterium RIFCSPLOWO2_12_FULL_64_8]|nr:MAG: hypothetical protein A3G75_10255 [Verrucomicrobia bacterium RIFCSPLOWO2_12_FULL_64_8]